MTIPNATHYINLILIYFLFCAFIWFYLWVRIDLPSKFFNAYAFTDLEKKINQIDRTYEKDSLAETLVSQQLDTYAGEETPSKEDLKQALINASEAKRNAIFEHVRQVRYSTWRKDKEKMEKTIPIFEIFTEINPNNYRYHAELAYAYNPNTEYRLLKITFLLISISI